jgi:uncharacterized protein with FMN-binding domain
MKKPLAILTASVIIILGGISAYISGIFTNNGENQTTPAPNITPTTTPTTNNKKYNTGTYSVLGSYMSPGGQEQFDLSVNLNNGIITSVTFQPKSMSKMGEKFGMMFNNGFSTQVVGKSIDSISLDVVNGASLTTSGFMDAMQTIKQKAQL